MPMLDARIRANRRAQIQSRVNGTPAGQRTEAVPGSEEKIKIMTERAGCWLETGREVPLHHRGDAQMPIGMGWRIRVGPNGRIIDKEIVAIDQAGLVIVAPRVTQTILEEIEAVFGRVGSYKHEACKTC